MSDGPITYDTRQVKLIETAIKRLQKTGANVDKPLKRFGVYHLSQTVKGFTAGRRGTLVWKKLSQVTLKIRKSHKIKGTKPLVARGFGKRSIQTTLVTHKKDSAVVTFTRLRYMGVHQTGGKSTIPTATVTTKKGTPYTRKARTINVPQRKFLHYTNPDIKQAVSLLMKHEREQIKAAGIKVVK